MLLMSAIQIEADVELLRLLRKRGILGDVSTERLPQKARSGSLMVCCADSDQFGDVFDMHVDYCGCNRCAPLNHFGGGLVIPRHSPAAALGQSDLVMGQLFLGYALGKGDIQFHLSHWPCGVARGYKLSALKCLELLCDAKTETLGYFERCIGKIQKYLDIVGGEEPSEAMIGEICMGVKLTRKEVLEIQRIHMCGGIAALRHVKMPDCKDVVSHFHVDWPVPNGEGKKKRTYHLDRKAFMEWMHSGEAERLVA